MKKSSLFSIYSTLFAENFGFGLAFTLFARLFLEENSSFLPSSYTLEYKNILLALLFGVFPLAQVIGAPILGDLADRKGRKYALIVTIFATILGYILSFISIYFNHLIFLIVSRLFTGFFSANSTICYAIIADSTLSDNERANHYGFAETIPNIGWILSIIVAGSNWPAAFAFLICALISLISLTIVILFFKETHLIQKTKDLEKKSSFIYVKSLLKNKKAGLLYFLLLVYVVGWDTIDQWFTAISFERFGARIDQIVFFNVIGAIGWILGSSYLNYLFLKRFSSLIVCFIGAICTAFFCWAATLSTIYPLFVSSIILANIFASFTVVNIISLISLLSPRKHHGKTLGISRSISSVGWIIGSLIAFLAAGIDISFIYVAASTLLTLAIFILAQIFLDTKAKEKN